MDIFDDNKTIEYIYNWISSKNWPLPAWYENKEHLSLSKDDYSNFFLQDLRGEYILLESDFRTILPIYMEHPRYLDLSTSEIIYEHLQAARNNLEQDHIDIVMMINELDFIQRSLIWVYPAHLLKPKAAYLKYNLEILKPLGWDYYQSKLDRIIKEYIPEDCSTDLKDFPYNKLYYIRSILDETIGVCNKQLLDEWINSGLQISRLQEIRKWGLILLFTFLGFASLIANSSVLTNWRYDFAPGNLYIKAFLLALSIALFGATGGFLSGLMDIRESKTDLAKYKESLIRTQLKPIVGAFAALLMYVFISYNVISGIYFSNLGTILLAAFISGFSERFFLRFIDVKIGEEEPKDIDKIRGKVKSNEVPREGQ